MFIRIPVAPPAAKAEASASPNAVHVDLEHEPLWAYGFDKSAAPGEVAQPQAPPNRKLRPDQDPAEQNKLRHLEGSKAVYSLVDIRDGQNVIDWFPSDHAPMPDVIAHGPARLGDSKRGCGSCPLPNGKGRPENAGVASKPRRCCTNERLTDVFDAVTLTLNMRIARRISRRTFRLFAAR